MQTPHNTTWCSESGSTVTVNKDTPTKGDKRRLTATDSCEKHNKLFCSYLIEQMGHISEGNNICPNPSTTVKLAHLQNVQTLYNTLTTWTQQKQQSAKNNRCKFSLFSAWSLNQCASIFRASRYLDSWLTRCLLMRCSSFFSFRQIKQMRDKVRYILQDKCQETGWTLLHSTDGQWPYTNTKALNILQWSSQHIEFLTQLSSLFTFWTLNSVLSV